MPNLSATELLYIEMHKQLYYMAKRAALVKQRLIVSYLARHYSGLDYTLAVVDENILAVDLVFPDVPPERGDQIVKEVIEYLNMLHREVDLRKGG